MPANWLSNSSEVTGRLADALASTWHFLSQPEQALRVRRLLTVLLLAWLAYALVVLVWALLPVPEADPVPLDELVNPASPAPSPSDRKPVDIDQVVAWHLFGEAGEIAVAEEEPAAADSSREGIERGARETRLDLTLRGVLASTEDGLGHAIIEHRSRQQVYAVDDELPVPGKVVLAKVMPTQVVLDNAGTYELLTLFDETELDVALQAAAREAPPAPRAAPDSAATLRVDKRADTAASELAGSYRDQLYQDPGSLAEVVRISAVREGGELRGYRVAPGRNAAQFEQLGFRAGDLVTAVNGFALDDPANTMRLYQAMRDAGEAVFDLERNGQPVSVAVTLGAGSGQQ